MTLSGARLPSEGAHPVDLGPGLPADAGLGLEVVGELGRGAQSVVYRVRRQGSDYALKLLSSPTGQGKPGLAAFRREAALLASLDHPGVPRVFEVGELSDRPYLVLEVIDGRPLADRLHGEPADEAQVLRLGMDVAGALAAAHRAGLVHRDVKPDNIMIAPDGAARLIDFGLATHGGGDAGDAVVGTLLYSAPEQTGMLKRPVDGRTDLYGLGVVLYEYATGLPPFTSADVGELIRLHATAPPPDPRTLHPELSPGLVAVIAKLLAKDPDDRYQASGDLLADLRRLSRAAGSPSGLENAPPADAHDEVASAVTDPRLVGRNGEYAQLTARWRDVLGGRGGIALVQGPPGGGKSRLARELTAEVRAGGRLVLHGKCSADDAVPLAPLRSAVDAHLHAVALLPELERAEAQDRVRLAAGHTASLLKALSPELAAVLQAPDLSADDRHEQFSAAVAAFLTELARSAGGAVLHIDDVQWLDGATRRVLAELTRALPESPLLLVATARDDEDSAAALEAFRTAAGPLLEPHLTLAPLTDDAVTELVTAQLGGVVDRELITSLARRTGGNPFTILEYVRAALDAGLLRPYWGSWLLDADGMDSLELSGDALALVLRRIEGLGDGARRLLVAASATGVHFDPALVARVCEADQWQVRDMLSDATGRRLIEARDDGRYAFLHGRIREALLADLDPAALRRLHQELAVALEESGRPGDPERVYALARHYMFGETDRAPDRVYAACAAAGRLALADHAPIEALVFLERAAAMAAVAGIVPDSAFHESLGVALVRNGRFVEGQELLNRALADERDPLRRATLHGLIAGVHLSVWEPERSLASTAQALAELGRPLPRNPLLLLVTTVVSFLAGLVVGGTRIGFGTVTGEARERYRIQASLYDIGAYAAALAVQLRLQAVYSFRSWYLVNRIGPGPEYVRRLAGFGVVANVARRHRLASRIFARADAAAAEVGDPTLMAHVGWKRGAGAYLGGVDKGETWVRELRERGRWMEIGDYLTGVSAWCAQMTQRGHTREAEAWYERGLARLGGGAHAEGSPLTAVGVAIPAQAGRPAEAARRLRPVWEFGTANPGNLPQRVNAVAAMLYVAAEQADFGEAFTDALVEVERLGLTPRRAFGEQRVVFVLCATGWLARLAAATGDDEPELRRAAQRAVADLGRTADSDVLRAHHLIADASLRQLTGAPERALRSLARADRLVERLDAPLLAYETARVRARVLRALGLRPAADRQASIALLYATQQGWPHRARWVRTEFGVTEPTAATGRGTQRESGATLLHKRQLAALQQVSLASATVLDPSELARVALDETVRILGAERAYLFLLDPELDELVPHLGRDADGHELGELTGYSSTLVAQVRETREAIVVTGSEEGAALGSQSAVVHGLRSIMIAPVLLDDRLLGVVYLDSRVAKGIFTPDDVDILVAITNHVAVSLETARAARLATIDGLTGLSNRNHFFDSAGRDVELARRNADPVAAIMLDIDHFKQVNDGYGHGVGDEVICAVADRLRRTCRRSDVVGRYGGEEFAVLTLAATGTGATGLAERLRAAVGDEPVATAAGPLKVTISVGVAIAAGGESDLGELLSQADAALYDAKRAGRDRVEVRNSTMRP